MSAFLLPGFCSGISTGQLVTVVSGNSKIAVAVMGCIAKRLLHRKGRAIMNGDAHSRDWINFTLEFDCSGEKRGLFLEETAGDSFSLKYRRMGDSLYSIPIGRNMSETRVRIAGEAILAMIVRGRGWKVDDNGKLFEAYGQLKDPNSGRVRLAKKRVRYLLNLSLRRRQLYDLLWV